MSVSSHSFKVSTQSKLWICLNVNDIIISFALYNFVVSVFATNFFLSRQSTTEQSSVPHPNCVRTVSSMLRYLCLSSSTRARCLCAGSSFCLNTSASLALISCSACLIWARTLSWFCNCKRHMHTVKDTITQIQNRTGAVHVTRCMHKMTGPFIYWYLFTVPGVVSSAATGGVAQRCSSWNVEGSPVEGWY